MNKHTETSRQYRSTKMGHVRTLLSRAKRRAKDSNLPFDLDAEYLMSIPSEKCPIFDIDLAWCGGLKVRMANSPSLDKIHPHLGYVKGNVAWISWRANRIKNDGTAIDHYKIAHWMQSNL
jgi:hypothetical protein